MVTYVYIMCGVGQTGSFITIDMDYGTATIKHEGIVDVRNTKHKLRFRRNFTVQQTIQQCHSLCCMCPVFSVFSALMESINMEISLLQLLQVKLTRGLRSWLKYTLLPNYQGTSLR